MHVGHILNEEPALTEQARSIREAPETGFPVLSAKVKITRRCNLRCRMCSLWRDPIAQPDKESPDQMDFGLITTALDALVARGLRKVHFSGGEVLLVNDFIDLVAYARNAGLQVNMTTNGTLLDKQMAKALVRHRVHTVAISVDSASAREHDAIRGQKGAWKSTVAGIQHLAEQRRRKGRGPKIAVNTLVSRASADNLAPLYELLQQWGVDSWRLLPLDCEAKKDRPTEEQWHTLSKQWKEWTPLLARLPVDWSSARSGDRASKGKYAGVFYGDHICYAPWFNLFIDSDGRAYPCCMGKRDMLPYGNLYQESIDRILMSDVCRQTRCSIASGHHYPICEMCDDFLEENTAFAQLCN
jgi:MoaA/NifB/PqqE/SkfB family radical SAM enzyme